MSGKMINMTCDQYEAILQALPDVIEELHTANLRDRLIATILSELMLKMQKQAIERKRAYRLKLTKPQEVAFLIAGMEGMFDRNTYLRMATDRINHSLLREHL